MNSLDLNWIRAKLQERDMQARKKVRDTIDAELVSAKGFLEALMNDFPDLNWSVLDQENKTHMLMVYRAYTEAEDVCFDNHESYIQLSDYTRFYAKEMLSDMEQENDSE